MKQRTTILAALAAAFLAGAPALAADLKTATKAAGTVYTDPLSPLTAADLAAYRIAFAAAERGETAQRDAALARVSNSSLRGRAIYASLTRRGAKPAWADLNAWLTAYGEQGGADRIYDLALKAKPRNAKPPRAPALVLTSGAAATADKGAAAREAYYSGDVRKALTLAAPSGERWIAGLAAYRLDRFSDARAQFAALAHDKAVDPWLRSAAAFWAARSATRAGADGEARTYLKLAADTPQTFYGMIAERQLALAGIEVAFDPIAELISRTNGEGADRLALASFAAGDARARRAAALAQLGRIGDAADELRTGLALAKTEKARENWMGLALVLNPQISAGRALGITNAAAQRPEYGAYPLPALAPKGGFTLDPALVYALVRQESGFNPMAVSHAGAVGLMQLMPVAAARAAGDDKLLADMSPLFDPAMNLRVGQDYFTWLMERGLNDYDLLRAVAAYNGGPGTLTRVIQQLGPDADSLLLIESLPALETRNYVEKVTAAYWAYRRLFGLPSGTLDALATGARTADIRLDVKAELPSAAVPAA
jgi:soluble lytic murein transglycosylase-like protein